MKQVTWALAVAGMLLLSSAIRVEAAGVGSRGGGSGWSGGAPRGSAWVGGGSHGGGGAHTGSVQGSHWYRGGSAGWNGGGHHGGDWHGGGTRVFIGGSVGWWGWPGWWGPGWWGYPDPYPYYVAPPAVVQPGPTAYIQQESAPPESTYWYYCKDAGAYYPYVKECPAGWMQVVPQSTPPGR